MSTAVDLDRYVPTWWVLFGAALFLLIPLDLLTTYAAVSKHGMVVEANPLMRYLLGQGLAVVTLVNIVVVAVVTGLFQLALTRIRRAPETSQRALMHTVNLWVGVLLLAGIALVTNNLLVVI